jgi:hypothetical protein
MKKSLSTILEKIEQRDAIVKLFRKESFSSIELMSEDSAELVRGGDKEYIPLYDTEDAYTAWHRPTILLNL